MFLREQDLSASLKPVLWVLSYRHKKVPPPAGIMKKDSIYLYFFYYIV